MKLLFDTMIYSNLVTKILMRAISNVHAGRRFPTSVLRNLIVLGYVAFYQVPHE